MEKIDRIISIVQSAGSILTARTELENFFKLNSASLKDIGNMAKDNGLDGKEAIIWSYGLQFGLLLNKFPELKPENKYTEENLTELSKQIAYWKSNNNDERNRFQVVQDYIQSLKQ